MNKSSVTAELLKEFASRLSEVNSRADLRFLFFDVFPTSRIVPVSYYDWFVKVAGKFYDDASTGYNGIMTEITERVAIARKNNYPLRVNDFLKHTDNVTDLYDSALRRSYEKKTGCGDWLVDKNATTLEKAIAIYRRKKRWVKWDYDFEPQSETMNGKKSFSKHFSPELIATMQETTKRKKDGTKIANKQYPIHIHVACPYSKFFDYLETYPAGIGTFFKLSSRTVDIHGNTCFVWQLQTIKNSRKKIEFLEYMQTWLVTGVPFEQYKAEQKAKEEQEEQED